MSITMCLLTAHCCLGGWLPPPIPLAHSLWEDAVLDTLSNALPKQFCVANRSRDFNTGCGGQWGTHRVWHILSQLALLQWLRSPAPATCQYSFAGSYYPSNLPAELPMWKWARDGRGVLSQLLGLTEVRWCAPEERAGRSEGSQSWESSLWRTPAGREKKKKKN